MYTMWILDTNVQNIIDYIANKSEFTEKEIKKKLKIKENEIRKVLYKLQELGIVYPIGSLIIKEGKYDFKWGTKITDIEKIYEVIIEKELKVLEEEKSKEQEIIYYCEECRLSYDFDTAEENDFKCTECGYLLIQKTNDKIFKINEKIEELKKLLEKVKTEKIKAKA